MNDKHFGHHDIKLWLLPTVSDHQLNLVVGSARTSLLVVISDFSESTGLVKTPSTTHQLCSHVSNWVHETTS